MNNTSKRVLLNSIVVYCRQILLLIISLISVPIIMRALGEVDYGLYNLVAGIIAMLSFLNTAMTVSTQRYLSVTIGEQNHNKLNSILNNSIILHLAIGVAIVVIFEIGSIFFFNGKLNIDGTRLYAAKVVYQSLVVSTFFTVIMVPFQAFMNAKEHMITLSLFGLADSILKFGLALSLVLISFDRLIYYGVGIACVSLTIAIVEIVYVMHHYKDITIKPILFFNKDTLKKISGFAGWNTFGAMAMIGRNQGTAIIMNLFYGPLANAAYGIANQLNGALSFFSSSFQSALNPQLMQSEGMNDRERLIRISLFSSKISVFVVALFALPLILEMDYVLKLWLHEVPQYTLRLSQLVLCSLIVFQYSSGLMSAIQAHGEIRNYFLIISAFILLNLPISYVLLSCGAPLYSCIVVFIIIEICSLIIRLILSKKYVGVRPYSFLYQVIVPTMTCMALAFIPAIICHRVLPESLFRVIVVSLVYLLIYFLVAWFILFDDNVKNIIKTFFWKKK